MHMGVIDTTATVQWRHHPVTGELQYRHVWEDDNLGGWFSSAWKSVTNVVKKVTKPIYEIAKTIEKKIIRPVIKPVAIGVATYFGTPALGKALYDGLQARDQAKAQKAAQAVADSAGGAPIEIPAREDVADPATYDKYMQNLQTENAAGKIANVRYWAQKLNAMPLRPAGSLPPVPAVGQPGGLIPGMTLPPTAPYFPAQSAPSSIEGQFIPGTGTPIPSLPPGYQLVPTGQPAQAGMGDIPMPLLLGGGALLLFMMTQRD